MKSNISPDSFFDGLEMWKAELTVLRNIFLSAGLDETMKWGTPTYTYNGKNIVGIAGFKSHFAVWFHNGYFLKDPHGVLVNAQENKTNALRQMRFSSIDDIDREILLVYVNEAIENQKQGKVFKPNREKPLTIPPELKSFLENNPALKDSFDSMGKGKQREFAEYISTAKQDKTKNARLEKIIPLLEKGIGLNDKYR